MTHGPLISSGCLAVADVSVTYRPGPGVVLDVPALTLTEGVTALVGVNGAGKSTLMSVLAGGRRPDTGRVSMGDVDLYGRGRRHGLSRIALMPQLLTLPGTMSARDALVVLAGLRGVPRGRIGARVDEALDRVGLSARAGGQVRRLSGGMQRRLALAQALVADPDVLLLDEPSTGLDPEQRRAMVDIVAGLGRTVLFSSHVMEDVLDVADRVLVLDGGRIRFDGTIEDLVGLAPAGTRPERVAEAGFLAAIAGSR